MEFWCNCNDRGKVEVLEEKCATATLLSANAMWNLLEMNAALRVEKLVSSRLSYDMTKFPVWLLDSLGSTGWGLMLFLIVFFRSEPRLLEYTEPRNLTTLTLKQRQEGTHGRS
jgi:hypothetical protein